MGSEKTSVHEKEAPCERDICTLSQITLQLKYSKAGRFYRIPNQRKQPQAADDITCPSQGGICIYRAR